MYLTIIIYVFCSYYVWALLVYNNSNNVVLEKDDILKKINGSSPTGLTLKTVDVFPVGKCIQCVVYSIIGLKRINEVGNLDDYEGLGNTRQNK